MHDVVFLSYDEPNADRNWERLRRRRPDAHRVHGVKGLFHAYRACALASRTESFFVVDGDCEVLGSFELEFEPTDENAIYCWRSLNPVNHLITGYGAVKLFPRRGFANGPASDYLDLSNSLAAAFRSLPEVACVTRFNTTPRTAWRGAFRECAKLVGRFRAPEHAPERRRRLRAWCHVGASAGNGAWVLRGARAGAAYGAVHRQETEALRRVNDYDWLDRRFAEARAGASELATVA